MPSYNSSPQEYVEVQIDPSRSGSDASGMTFVGAQGTHVFPQGPGVATTPSFTLVPTGAIRPATDQPIAEIQRRMGELAEANLALAEAVRQLRLDLETVRRLVNPAPTPQSNSDALREYRRAQMEAEARSERDRERAALEALRATTSIAPAVPSDVDRLVESMRSSRMGRPVLGTPTPMSIEDVFGNGPSSVARTGPSSVARTGRLSRPRATRPVDPTIADMEPEDL